MNIIKSFSIKIKTKEILVCNLKFHGNWWFIQNSYRNIFGTQSDELFDFERFHSAFDISAYWFVQFVYCLVSQQTHIFLPDYQQFTCDFINEELNLNVKEKNGNINGIFTRIER